MIGIYKITNMLNGKSYIGKSNCVERRFAQHKSPYEQNRHKEYPLYQAFQKYGIQNFKFEILEECSDQLLNEKEKYYIKKYHTLSHDNGYNVRAGGDGHEGEDHPGHKLITQDVIDIRTSYKNHERCKDVECKYRDKIGHSGFSKIWKGETWTHIMPEVYTKDNKDFHLHNTGQKGSENGRAKLSEEDVIAIRVRKKNGEY